MPRSNPMVLLLLLVTAVGVNYIDRGSLSVVKSNVAAEFGLNDTRMGLLFSAFFWSYALCQLLAGWWVDRWDVKVVYAAGFAVWSLATVAMGLAASFPAFFVLRLLLGLGESVAYPATSRILSTNYPEEGRGWANALVDAGSKLGPALSTLLGGLLVARFGWRALFLCVGCVSLVWLIPWWLCVPRGASGTTSRTVTSTPTHASVAWPELLVRREVWGTSFGMFCLGYSWFFLVSWLPDYLERERGFSKSSMAVFGSLPFWAMAATSLAGGWISDRWIRMGYTPTRVRKSFLIAGLVLCAALMVPAVLVRDARACVAYLTAACAALGLFSSNVWAVTQTLAGPGASGKWTGLQNCIGNFGGVVSPALTGWLVTQTRSFTLAFVIAAGMLLLGAVTYLVWVGRVAPLQWGKLSAARTPVA